MNPRGSQVGVGVGGGSWRDLGLWAGLPAFLSGSPAFLGPLSNFPSPKSSRRCLPEYSEKAGAPAAAEGRGAHPVISSASSFPGAQPSPRRPPWGSPGTLHRSRKPAAPSQALGEFKASARHPPPPPAPPLRGAPPGSDPAGGGHALLSGPAP